MTPELPTYQGDLHQDTDGSVITSPITVGIGRDIELTEIAQRLEGLPIELLHNPDMNPSSANVIAIRGKNSFTEPGDFEDQPELFGLVRAGNGIDNISDEVADRLRILLMNTPEGSRNGVAEMALGHTLGLLKRTSLSSVAYADGQWLRGKPQIKPVEFRETRVGVIGAGEIGIPYMQMCAALGATDFVYFDQENKGDIPVGMTKKGPIYAKYVDLDTLASTCDVISMHAGGKKMIMGPEEIAKMKKGAALINTGRPANMDYGAASQAAIDELIGLGVDVSEFEKNDEKFDKPTVQLLQKAARLGRATITHHQSASSEIAETEVLDDTATRIREIITLGVPHALPLNLRNPSNVSIGPPSEPSIRMVVTYGDKTGAHHDITGVLTKHDISFGGGVIFGDAKNSNKIATTVLEMPDATDEEAIKVKGEIEALEHVCRVRLLRWAYPSSVNSTTSESAEAPLEQPNPQTGDSPRHQPQESPVPVGAMSG